MKTFLKKAAVGIGLGVAAVAMTAAPAQARHYRGYHGYHGYHGGYYHHGDAAGAAILGGIVGLGVGAAIADRGDRGYYDGYYAPPPPPPGYYGYRYDYQPACWTQWRWDPYWHRNVPVRVCN